MKRAFWKLGLAATVAVVATPSIVRAQRSGTDVAPNANDATACLRAIRKGAALGSANSGQ
ncbi:hypothetical protein EKH79_03340 [Dyella dinghuensis]|uniref:Uncharacterized protein n=1 Tax=Dyella dinghuensis TaxID=1920169 RepID=A0A432LUW7_9GAMM|nr:hypothetical protein [Dyella dinghuensis]RUL65758.1 hypothetical protein EKH79_03340 [Dyella dinghuensis]